MTHGWLRLTMCLALLLAACAQPPPSLDPARAGTRERPRDVNVILRDYVFVPTPIQLVPGEVVRFNIINGGLVAHEFVLGDRDVQAAWASAEALATAPIVGASAPPASVPASLAGARLVLASGASGALVYEVPDAASAARLELACQIPGHVAQGMVGQLRFVPAASSAAQP